MNLMYQKKNITCEKNFTMIEMVLIFVAKEESSQGKVQIQINLNVIRKDPWRASDLAVVVQGQSLAESPSCFHVQFERHHWKLPSSV